jgi:hypothetical protein
MSQQIIINVGVSGSGKSTWSKDYIRTHPRTIRINRDDLRKCLRGTLDDYYQSEFLNSREDLINKLEEHALAQALLKGFDVIIDNTNLKPSYIMRWVDFIKYWNDDEIPENQATFNFKIFPESHTETLKKRINIRDAPLGWDKLNYIDKQVASLPEIIKYINKNFLNQIIHE